MSPRILLVEDNDQLRNLMATSLRLDKYEVTTAENGFIALDTLNAAPADLLITDIVMSGMDGIELALIASQQWPLMKIILISGYEEERSRAVNLSSLIHSLLSKPFGLQELKRVIADALTTTSKTSPALLQE